MERQPFDVDGKTYRFGRFGLMVLTKIGWMPRKRKK